METFYAILFGLAFAMIGLLISEVRDLWRRVNSQHDVILKLLSKED